MVNQHGKIKIHLECTSIMHPMETGIFILGLVLKHIFNYLVIDYILFHLKSIKDLERVQLGCFQKPITAHMLKMALGGQDLNGRINFHSP